LWMRVGGLLDIGYEATWPFSPERAIALGAVAQPLIKSATSPPMGQSTGEADGGAEALSQAPRRHAALLVNGPADDRAGVAVPSSCRVPAGQAAASRRRRQRYTMAAA
jgi:hypothetical protein